MSLYFGTTEITKLRNLAPQSGLDITDIWFGSTNIYTVWQTYEGALPATIDANGDDMRQYKIYGNTGGVGDRTINLLNFENFVENTNLSTTTGLPTPYPGRIATESPIDVSSYDAVTISFEGAQGIKNLKAILSTFTAGNELLSRAANIGTGEVVDTSNVAYMYVCIYQVNLQNIYKSDILNAMLTPRTTPPASYEPYGYKLDMAIGSNILQSSEIEWGGWQAAAGTVPGKIDNPMRCRSKDIYQISGEKIFYDFKSLNVNIAFVDSNGVSLGGTGFKTGAGSVDVPANVVKCLFIIANTDNSAYITPAQVITAGIWAIADATTTPIYIGESQLAEGEYVSYGERKIYKHTDNSCPPQDSGAWNAGYINTAGNVSNPTSAKEIYSDYIAVSSDQTYNFKNFNSFPVGNAGSWYAVGIYDANKNFISRPASSQYGINDNLKYHLPSNAAYVRLTFRTYDTIDNQLSFTLGDIPPAQFIPYIMPADPPVPLPALPMVEGTTIVDYAGSGTAPEKVMFKYRKEGF